MHGKRGFWKLARRTVGAQKGYYARKATERVAAKKRWAEFRNNNIVSYASARMAGRRRSERPTHSGGLRIYGNPHRGT